MSKWGEESTAKFAGSGSPVGAVTPTGEGDLYVDNTTPALWQATGATNTDWQQVGGSQAFLSATVPVSSAEILLLHTVPKTIVPTPGPGQMILLSQAAIEFVKVTTPYTLAPNIFLSLCTNYAGVGTDQSAWVVPAEGLIDQAASSFSMGQGFMQQVSGLATAYADKPLILVAETASPTAGDGTLVVTVGYMIVPVT